MKRIDAAPLVIGSIREFCRLLELPPPEHPLVSVIRVESIRPLPAGLPRAVLLNFFSVRWNNSCKHMRFFLPGQVLGSEVEEALTHRGWWLLIHPDLLWNFSIDKNIRQYGFFCHAVHETLYLGEKEEQVITGILQDIEQAYLPPTSVCWREAILSHVETLFVFADRFYNRSRKSKDHGQRGHPAGPGAVYPAVADGSEMA
jgi:AraC family transcriptional regulator, transcriptional activator of pobA